MRRVLIAIALLLVPTLALAQAETTGRVTGTVLDEDRKPVAGAEITLESPALQGQRKSASDANGRYLASLLPPGVYTMTVNAPGKTPLQYTFRVGIGQTVPIDAVLKSGADLVEDVVVFSPATKLQTTAGGENFNFANTIDQLPVTNRTLENVANLAPNVSFGPTPGTLSISGAPSFDTNVLLDGSEVSDPYFGSAPTIYLEEAIEEVQVLTNGVSAKYGRFQGGVINATTKSGGNTFDGAARVDFSKQSWNAKTPYNENQSDTLQKVYSATIGGPILKDRLWFFAGGRTIPEAATTATTLETGESYTTVRNEDRWQLKLTGAITPNHVIEASYLEYAADSTDRAGLPAGDALALGKRSDPRDIIAAEYQGVITDKMFINAQATQKQVSIQSGGDPAKGSPFLDFYGSGFQILHNHWWDFNDASVRDNETANLGLTNVLTTESWGDHTLEYGLQYVNSITAGQNIQSSTGFNFLNYDALFASYLPPGFGDFATCVGASCTFNVASYYDFGLSYRWEAIPFSGDQTLENTAFYLQDSWEIDKWRFDVGVRYDDWQGKGPFPTLDLDFQEISPRIGATYNMTPEWQIQASWGKYVSRFNDNVASNITGVGGAPYIVSIYTGPSQTGLSYDDVEALLRDDANWGIITTISDPSQPIRYLASNASAPYATDLNLAVKRALPRNTGSVTLTYTQREFKDLLDDFVGDQVVNGSPYTTVDDPKGSGASFDFDNEVWANCSTCSRDYDAISAAIDYRPSAKWDIGGNYTYSRTRGNYEGEGRNTPSSGSIIGNYPRSVDQATAFPFGYTDDDIRHRLRLWGDYRFDFGRAGNLTLGGIFWYRSGQAWNRTAGASMTSDASYLNEAGQSYTKFFDGRGNNRFDGFWNLDTSIKYQFSFWRDLGMYVKADILNVTNEDSLIAYDTTGTVVTGSNPARWAPRRANEATGTCEVLGGSPVAYPNRNCRNFGRIRNEGDYQAPRQYSVSVGLVF
jgi:hypothetical protein